MRASYLMRILTVATVVVGGMIVGIILFPPSYLPNVPLDAVAILGVAGLAAVGIERIIEGIWSIMDICVGAFWPLDTIAKLIEVRVDALGQPLKPYIKQFSDLVDQASIKAKRVTPKQIEDAQGEFKTSFDQMKKVAARNGSSQFFITGMEQKLRDMQKNLPLDDNQINTALTTMKAGIEDFDKFVNSFKDNPGRRLISLYLGILLGLAVAWVLGLDLLATVLKTGQNHSVALGIIIAGVVMGLGSSPAHEIIQAILNWRKSL